MPRERIYSPEDQTPFARRLQDWMWSQRPPMTNGKVAIRVGVSSQVVWDWLNRGSIPTPMRLPALEKLTGIPLVEWYELAGYPVPGIRVPPLAEPNEARWDWLVQTTTEIVRRGMRRDGVDERTIEQALQEIVADIRREQEGANYVPYVEREFASPPPERTVEADEQPTQPLLPTPRDLRPQHEHRAAPRRKPETTPPRRAAGAVGQTQPPEKKPRRR